MAQTRDLNRRAVGTHEARPQRRGDRPEQEETRARAEELVRTTGIPRNLAFQVAMGNLDLNVVLQRMAVRDRVDSLIARHGMMRSLATQVALGQVPLDDVLRKQRQGVHLAENRERSALVEAWKAGKPLALALHGQRVVRGLVTDVDAYEVCIQPEGGDPGGGPERHHKLQVKFAYDPAQYKQVRKALTWDKARKCAREPIARPQERYGCSDRRLFGYFDRGTPVQATTLEGEQLRGRVSWVGRWEFGLELARGGACVTVMRHALDDIREVE